ncbi:cilia- and flagella-associated protein 161-like isoform X2 [Synchiropus splendidus]|uniref:cilia- and flagella-associated protein 161-like isoform X2 n=1 Tax=Synchiropus splendidus TaxID=270530 RepID=UPI00237E6A87|nr:cilia- and flagella-associated protein 161-like isoform X2 [Synchiropus splendidus]
MAGFRTYRTTVKLDNWFEDRLLEEDEENQHLAKVQKGELNAQKVDFIKHHMMRPVQLTVSADKRLHFGDVVMLLNIEGENPVCTTLSVNAEMNPLRKIPFASIVAPCGVSGGRRLQACVRTAFVITSVDGTPEGCPLLFDQSFALRTTSGFAGGLYLTSEPRSFHKSAKLSRLQEVNLESELTFESWWKVVFFDPEERMEFEGRPVPANVRVVIVHCKTNQALAVLGNFVQAYSRFTFPQAFPQTFSHSPSFFLSRTIYGNEFEVTAHSFLDCHRTERDNNHWIVCTGDPSGEGLLFFSRTLSVAAGMETIEQCRKEFSLSNIKEGPVAVTREPCHDA